MEQESGSEAPAELLYEMLQAGNAYLEHPNDENLRLADIAGDKVRFSERKSALTESSDKYANVPLNLKQEFIRACDEFQNSPTAENRTHADRIWSQISGTQRATKSDQPFVLKILIEPVQLITLTVNLIVLLILNGLLHVISSIFRIQTDTERERKRKAHAKWRARKARINRKTRKDDATKANSETSE